MKLTPAVGRKYLSPEGAGIRRVARYMPTVIVAALFAIVTMGSANAQLYTGSVSGVVTDQSGAVVPQVQVTLVDTDKGFTFLAKTDGSGRYLFRQVSPGNYKVSITAPNFQPELKEGVTVAVNQNVSVDFALKVGTVGQSVDVSARRGRTANSRCDHRSSRKQNVRE